MRLSCTFAILFSIPSFVFGQNYTAGTFAGGSPISVNGIPVTLEAVDGLAVDAAGNVYAALPHSAVVLRFDPSGNPSLVAGNGTAGFGGDNGQASGAELSNPSGVAVDASGNVYIADTDNDCVRKVDTGGVITTIAGNETSGYGGDNGPAADAQLSSPSAVAVDASGNIYIADTGNNRVRRISSGTITTVAGNGTAGFSGDNGAATTAELNAPSGLAVDASGNLYIADVSNNVIRKVSGGVITTIAGNATPGFGGDNGPATSAQLNSPYGVAVDGAGVIYIADTGNNRVRRVANGAIATIAGTGVYGFSGDGGPASAAQLEYPEDLAVNASGDVYIADSNNGRLRILVPANLYPGGQSLASGGGNGQIALAVPNGVAWTASTTDSWITITGGASGTGSGTVSFSVQANTGAARTGTITVGGQIFSIEQESSSTAGLSFAGSMAQIASAGGWDTSLTLVNLGAST
ncbi:MAG: BACON domain-containing carbohydrate-binding protein, partial [Bryobacteraceae bacterium]